MPFRTVGDDDGSFANLNRAALFSFHSLPTFGPCAMLTGSIPGAGCGIEHRGDHFERCSGVPRGRACVSSGEACEGGLGGKCSRKVTNDCRSAFAHVRWMQWSQATCWYCMIAWRCACGAFCSSVAKCFACDYSVWQCCCALLPEDRR